MSFLIDFLSAGGRVLYDKTYDYFYRSKRDNIDNDNIDGDNTKSDTINIDDYDSDNDGIENYNSVLNINSYTDEKDNKRILPEVGPITEYSYYFSEPSKIIDNIYLGSAHNAASKRTLDRLNIKVILNVTREIRNYFPDDYTYVNFDIYDNNRDSIEKHLEYAFKMIKYYQRNSEGNILIHCFMGRSRSASMVIYYIMKTKGVNFDEALKIVKKKRLIINPTFRFTKDLAKSMLIK